MLICFELMKKISLQLPRLFNKIWKTGIAGTDLKTWYENKSEETKLVTSA